MNTNALVEVIQRYARTLTQEFETGAVLHRLTTDAMTVLDAAGAGVSLAGPDGRLHYVAATDERVKDLEAQQLAMGEGVCHAAYEAGETIAVPDLRADGRWPAYTQEAAHLGLRAVLGVPMTMADTTVGALNVYWQEAHEWTSEESGAAQALADMATGYLLTARRVTEMGRTAEELQHAVDEMICIEQAKGIVASERGTDPTTAFEILRERSEEKPTTLRDLAEAVVRAQRLV